MHLNPGERSATSTSISVSTSKIDTSLYTAKRAHGGHDLAGFSHMETRDYP